MNKGEYIRTLHASLSHLPQAEREDVIRDQEEYIHDAIAGGRTEEDVIKGLGDPRQLAQSLSAESKIQQARTAPEIGAKLKYTFGALIAILALAPFNLIFVLGPLMFLIGMLVLGWALSGTAALVGVMLVFAYPFKFLVVSIGAWAHVGGFFFLLGTAFAGVFSLLAMTKISQWFLQGLLAYLNWNVNFVRGRAA